MPEWHPTYHTLHQQIPCFRTGLTVITIIVQIVTAVTAYIATGSQFHGDTALAQHVTVCRLFTKFH